jgi:hypothetical protein
MSLPPCCARMLKGTRGIWISDPVVRGAHCRAGGALPCAPTFTSCGGGALPCGGCTAVRGAHCRAPLHLRRAGGGRIAVRPYIYAVRGAHCRAGGALPCGGRIAVRGGRIAVRGGRCRAPRPNVRDVAAGAGAHCRAGGTLPCAPTFTPCRGRPYLQPSPTFNLQPSPTFNLQPSRLPSPHPSTSGMHRMFH